MHCGLAVALASLPHVACVDVRGIGSASELPGQSFVALARLAGLRMLTLTITKWLHDVNLMSVSELGALHYFGTV